jgi:lipopolysaccharide export system protein LptA
MLIPSSVVSQSVKRIEIIRANSLEFDERTGIQAKRLLGDVVFKHDEAFMFCDSAYFYDSQNYIEAFNRVRIVQGDSLLLFGQKLKYDGESKLAQIRDSVILKHHGSFLLTDSLDYDRIEDVGYYFEGGRIFDGENRLSSRRGYYYAKENVYYAVDTVELRNPQYTIFSDTLKYDTETAIAYFYGPTHIVSDSNFIYCENGFYDTENDLAGFSENSWLKSGQNTLKGDSLFYDRNIRFGEAFKNVSIHDSIENITAYGHYGYYFEDPQFAMLTDSVLVVYISEGDSIFMSSDTVFISVDTAENKLIRAFFKVQVYKSDMQARCDSLVYSTADSLAELFYDPVVWLERSQLTADFMYMYIVDNNPVKAVLENSAYIIEHVDSIYYNQVKGKEIVAHIRDKAVYKAEIFGNAETLYYVEDEEEQELMAQNKVICSNMTVFISDQSIDRIWFYEKPDGHTIPLEMLLQEQMFLKDFRNLEEYRPKSKNDIFIWLPMK